MLSLRLRTYAAALLTALIGCALAAPAGAATKPYSVVVSPRTVPANTSIPFQAKITNQTRNQTLGSADLTVPDTFSITSVAVGAGTVSRSGNTIQLRNLGIAFGKSVTATITATVISSPCAAASFTWGVIAKQSNDFSGLPGNDFGPLTPDSSLTTITTCGGTATQCPGVNCGDPLTDPVSGASLTVSTPDSGLLTLTLGGGLDCAGYAEVLPKVDFGVDFLPDPGTLAPNTKTVTLNIPKAAMQASANNGLAQVNICFEAPFKFASKLGLQGLPNGTFRGLLPDCGTPPCVLDRQSVNGGAKITVLAPGGDKDPRYGG